MHQPTARAPLALALALAALSAHAVQGPGTLRDVTGNVNLGGQGFVTKALNGAPVPDGATLLVPIAGSARIVFPDGCTITLRGSQRLTLDTKLNCMQLQASVQQLGTSSGMAQSMMPVTTAASTGGLGTAAVVGGMLGLGAALAGGAGGSGSGGVGNSSVEVPVSPN